MWSPWHACCRTSASYGLGARGVATDGAGFAGFALWGFGMQPHDVIFVTNAPLYEYNKILTAIYRTFSIVGVAKGSLTTTTTF